MGLVRVSPDGDGADGFSEGNCQPIRFMEQSEAISAARGRKPDKILRGQRR